MHPTLGWTLLGLFLGSILLWRLAPTERKRIRFVWALTALALVLLAAASMVAAPPWVAEAAFALGQVVALHLGVILVFRVLLRRIKTPRILIDLAVVAGYVAVLIAMLTRLGVNYTGILATSAVVTAVIGFGLQDLLGNLAGGLAMQVEQTISEGDWIKTDQYFGQVRSVRVRHTALETPDGDTILAPNSAITRSAVTVIGRTSAGGPIKHRKLVTFFLPYDGHSPAAVVEEVERALAASPMEGVAESPRPRCVVVDYQAQQIQYGALVWLTRPGFEYVDVSGVRTRISFALARSGFPLRTISYVVDVESRGGHSETQAAEREAALRGVEIFQSLTEDERAELASRLKKLSFAPGEVILRQGDEGDSLFILSRGKVRIFLSGESGLSEQVACLSPGDFFGEMSLLTGDKRTATAIAIGQADCYSLSKDDLSGLLNARPTLAQDIATLLMQRQEGLAAAREKLDEEVERQRASQRHGDLLSRIRNYFAMR